MAKKGKYTYDWPRPMVAADAAVFGFFAGKARWRKPSWRLLLVNRKNQPFKGKWCLPGGFVDIDEELEDAAARELAEETGLVGVQLEQMHTFGNIGRDPRGRVITVTFMGIVADFGELSRAEGQNKLKAGDDAAEAKWFDVEKLPKDLAFDHNEVVRFAIEKLKKRKIYQLNIKRRGNKTIKRG
jgi:8-oxo-dGTP diphosphatase